MPVYKPNPNVNVELDLSGVDTTLPNNGEVHTTTITPSALNDVFLLEFLAKLEEYEPKDSLMQFSVLKHFDPLTHEGYFYSSLNTREGILMSKWEAWKASVADIYAKSWEEIAPLIYRSVFS